MSEQEPQIEILEPINVLLDALSNDRLRENEQGRYLLLTEDERIALFKLAHTLFKLVGPVIG